MKVLHIQTSAKSERKCIVPVNLSITKDNISAVLERRWIACYMLYDWNYLHAENAFDTNELERFQKAIKILNRHPCAASELDQKLTEAYNRVLMKDIESFINQHMKSWSADRIMVELELARAEAELFQC